MNNSPEKNEDTRSLAQKIRDAIREKISGADATGKQKITDEVKDDIKKVKQHVDVAYDAYAKGKDGGREGGQVLKTIIKVAEAAKAGLIALPNAKGQALLLELAENVDTPQYATNIEKHLRDYLFGGKDIAFSAAGAAQKSDFEKAFDQLKAVDSGAAELVGEALQKKATDLGTTQEAMIAKFQVEEAAEEAPREEVTPGEEASLEQMKLIIEKVGQVPRELINTWSPEKVKDTFNDLMIAEGTATWTQDYRSFYANRIKNKEDIEFLKTLYHPRDFIKYVNKRIGKQVSMTPQETKALEEKKTELKEVIRKEAEKKKETLTETEINQRVDDRLLEIVSQEISQKLINILDKVHVQLSRERPSEFYEEVAEKDFFHGIRVTIDAVRRAISSLHEELKSLEKDEKLDLQLYRYFEGKEEVLPVGLTGEEGKEIEKTFIRMRPLLEAKKISSSDFAVHLELLLNYYTHSRRYLHNVGAILNLPADPQKGFYEGLKGYAEKLQGTDVDEILAMPDGDLVLEAYQLYEKFVEEQFARQDWKHESNQFSTAFGSISSRLEEQILDALQAEYPDYDRDRLVSALYMGKGLARGAFLTEEEKAAYADPPLTPSGGGTFVSYYTTDAIPLMVFNPSHMFIRWQGEANLYPWLFLPIEDLQGIAKRGWNHKEIYDNLIKYRESYWKGREKLKDPKTGNPVRLLIDDLVDFGNVGGPSKRRGWRMLYFIKDYFVHTKDAKVRLIHRAGIPQAGLPEFDVLKTWQNIEKIGWEVVFDFISGNRIGDANAGFLNKGEFKGKREEFFQYLYKTYFLEDKAGFDAYMNKLRAETRYKLEGEIREGELSPKSIDEAVEEATSKAFLNRMLARYIAKTFPTKFLRIDRDRFNEDGISTWKRVRTALGWDPDRFDKVMKNLSLAENLLRKQVSKEMRDHTRTLAKDEEFFGFDSIDYKLDEAKIRELLGKTKLSGDSVEDAIEVYNKIKDLYFDKGDYLDSFGDNISTDPEKFYTFTFGIEQTDLSFLLFKRAGPRTIPRSIGDTATMEQHMMNGAVLKLQGVLQQMAVGEKRGDFSPLIQILNEVYQAYIQVHGAPQGYEAVHKLASAAIAYFRKDDVAKIAMGAFASGRLNSIAAEVAGRGTAVWEWDATDIDKFVIALESNGLLKKNPYDLSIPGETEQVYIRPSKFLKKIPIVGWLPFEKVPFLNKAYKTPWETRKKDYPYNGHDLREKYGGDWNHVIWEFINKYGPLFLIFMLYKFITEAQKEAEGKKQ
ncbi:hypothetical protein HYW87_01985 [Candidatus Roizmanbacteria bacterium]|nr:hypothetical protein [Candidatus Roizmanbacteria bacterium]